MELMAGCCLPSEGLVVLCWLQMSSRCWWQVDFLARTLKAASLHVPARILTLSLRIDSQAHASWSRIAQLEDDDDDDGVDDNDDHVEGDDDSVREKNHEAVRSGLLCHPKVFSPRVVGVEIPTSTFLTAGVPQQVFVRREPMYFLNLMHPGLELYTALKNVLAVACATLRWH